MRKLLSSLLLLASCLGGVSATAQSHRLPTTDGVNNWTGQNSFVPGNLRLGTTNITCSGSQVMTGFSNTFTPLCQVGSGGVSSVNTLSGALTLAAGTNIGLVASGNTITISSTASNGVTNVNSITGAVSIVAGTNITVTPSGQTLTIASTATGAVSSVNTLTGAVVFAAGSNITLTPSGNTVTIASTGGAGGTGVTSLNSGTGALNITAGSGITVTPSGSNIAIAATGTAAGVSSVNSLTGAVVLAAGANVTLTPSGNTVTIASTGGGGGGPLNTLANDTLTNTAGNATAQDMYNFQTSATYTNQNAVTAAAAHNGVATLLPRALGLPTGTGVFTNTSNVKVNDLANLAANARSLTEFGAQCNARQVFVSVPLLSTTATIYNDFFNPFDVGSTITLVGTVGGIPTAFETVIGSLIGGGGGRAAQAQLTTAAPVAFPGNNAVLGHDDTANINQGVAAMGGPPGISGYAGTTTLQIPGAACLTHQLVYTGYSISGVNQDSSALDGFPGESIFVEPDPSTGSASGGNPHMHDFTAYVDNRIDATQPWQIINDSGTISKAALYQPTGIMTGAASNPLAPGWFQGSGYNFSGAYNGVGAISSSTPSSMTVPAGGRLPVPAQKIVFPYLPTVFTTTVSSVNTGTRVVTLAGSYPGATGSQIEWFAGTSPQTLAVATTSGTCPTSVVLTNSIAPSPVSESNVAPVGLIQIDGEQFTYSGKSNAATPGQSFLTITACGQNGTSRVNHAIGATVVPLNPFKPATPWPVTPTINGGGWSSATTYSTGQLVGTGGITYVSNTNSNINHNPQNDQVNWTAVTTPANAAFYPAWNVGSGFLEVPNVNGGIGNFGQGAMANATINNIFINQYPTNDAFNRTTGFYFVALPYNTSFRDLTITAYYGIEEGVPSFNGGAGWASAQPTADGSRWEGIRINACNGMNMIAGNQNTYKDFNMYSQCESTLGTTVGANTAWYFTDGWSDQNGGAISFTSVTDLVNMYAEPETGPQYGLYPVYEMDTLNSIWDNMHMGGGGENYVGGNNNHFRGGNFNNTSFFPTVDWGTGNSSDYATLLNIDNAPTSNTYGTTGMIEFGYNSNWIASMGAFSNGAFGPAAIGMGAIRQPVQNQTNEGFNTGNVNPTYVSSGGGFIPASEFNTSFSWESNPFEVPWHYDGSLLPDGVPAGGAVGCLLSGTATIDCFSFRFNQGAIYVGPGQRIAAGKYTMYVAAKSTGAATSYTLTVGACSPGNVNGGVSVPVSSTYSVFQLQVDFTPDGSCGGGIGLGFGFGNAADTLSVAYVDFAPVGQRPTDTNINILNQVQLSGAAGTAGQCLVSGGATSPDVWGTCGSGTPGGGSVTSVALTVPSWLSVSGSPVVSAGTLAIGSAALAPNLVIASPVSGGTGPLAARSLVVNDIPTGLPYIGSLTNDVTATGTGAVAANVNSIGGGTLFSTFSGLLQNTAGIVTKATTFNLTGSGTVGTSFTAGVEQITFSATPVFNASLANGHYITLTGNVTSSTFSGGQNGQMQEFKICQDSTGGRSFLWPTNFSGFPAVTQTASQCTTAMGWYDSVATTVWGDQYNAAQCVNAASSNVPCGSATRGYFAVPAGTNSTLAILTSGVIANSGFAITPTPGAGALLGVTCNATPPAIWGVSTWTAGTSFTFETYGTTSTNAECFSWSLVNP